MKAVRFAAYGGPEADPLTMLTAIETLARADGAAGWCSMIASTTASQALFLPPDMDVNVLLRVLVGTTAFVSAYMAEVVRGGLQAIPKGQYDAAHALHQSALVDAPGCGLIAAAVGDDDDRHLGECLCRPLVAVHPRAGRRPAASC